MTITGPAVAEPSRPAPWDVGRWVWLLAVLPQAARVWGHGPAGRTGAWALLLLGAVVVVALVVDGVRPPARLAAVVVLGAAGWWTVTPFVGRAPWVLVLVGVGVAALACGWWPHGAASVRVVGGAPSATALVVLVVQAGCWFAFGSVPTAAALFAVAGAGSMLSRGGLGGVPALDRRIAPAVRRVVSPVRRPLRAARTWWERADTAGPRWAGGVAAACSTPVFWRLTTSEALLVHGTNDFEAHVRRAVALSLSPLFVSVPHPVWHLSFLGVRAVVGRPLAITLIGAVATGVLVGLLVTVGRGAWDDVDPMAPRAAVAFGLSYLVAENVAQVVPRGTHWWQRLDLVGARARGTSYYPLHQWGSPTITMALPLSLLMVLLVLFAVRGDLVRARRHRFALLITTVVATMTLPAATLALVPAVPVYLVLARRVSRERLAVLVPWCLVPGVLCVLAQTLFLASGVSSFEATTWRWNPGWLVPLAGMDRPVFWLLLVVVPLGGWLVGRRFLADAGVGVSLTMLAVSLPPALLLQQTAADKAADGDLAMPAYFAGVLLTVFAVRLLVVELQRHWQARRSEPVPAAAVVTTVVLGLMLLGGTLDLLGAAGVVPEF